MIRQSLGTRTALIAALLLNAALLSACGSGSPSAQSTQAAPVAAASSTAAGTTTTTTTTTTASAPTITGTAATTVSAGSAYRFTPTVGGASSALTFTIANKPAWASFDTATGTLSGTPAASDIGTYANIGISVTAGSLSASLATFTIAVSPAAVQTGTAVLTWTPPTQNTDGSTLSDLGGYFIYYGSSPNALTNRIQISNSGLTAYTVTGLPTGTTYFAISAYAASGVESALSNIGSKVI